MILLIDNYDSFVFNLARYVEELGCETQVVRNDAITVDEIERMSPGAILLSPGPCGPRESGICPEVVRRLGPSLPMLGVCLGHQVMADALGGLVVRSETPVHGQASAIRHAGTGLFAGLPNPLTVGRYHSLVCDPGTLPQDLEVTSRTADDVVMSFQHQRWPMFGVQFHPESVMTDGGHRMLANFLSAAGFSPRLPAIGDLPEPPPDDFYARPVEWPAG